VQPNRTMLSGMIGRLDPLSVRLKAEGSSSPPPRHLHSCSYQLTTAMCMHNCHSRRPIANMSWDGARYPISPTSNTTISLITSTPLPSHPRSSSRGTHSSDTLPISKRRWWAPPTCCSRPPCVTSHPASRGVDTDVCLVCVGPPPPPVVSLTSPIPF
jgi:hypothetical protein